MASNVLQVRGAALWGRREWVERNHGQEALEAFTRELSPAGRNLFRSEIDKHGWYNYLLFIELCEKLDRTFGDGDYKLNVECGRFSAHLNTPGIFQMFIRLGSPEWVLNRASKLWREHFTAGSLAIHREGNRPQAEAEIVEWPVPHLAHSFSVLGFAIGAIEMSGARDVRGELVSCRSLGGDTTRLRVSWSAA